MATPEKTLGGILPRSAHRLQDNCFIRVPFVRKKKKTELTQMASTVYTTWWAYVCALRGVLPPPPHRFQKRLIEPPRTTTTTTTTTASMTSSHHPIPPPPPTALEGAHARAALAWVHKQAGNSLLMWRFFRLAYHATRQTKHFDFFIRLATPLFHDLAGIAVAEFATSLGLPPLSMITRCTQEALFDYLVAARAYLVAAREQVNSASQHLMQANASRGAYTGPPYEAGMALTYLLAHQQEMHATLFRSLYAGNHNGGGKVENAHKKQETDDNDDDDDNSINSCSSSGGGTYSDTTITETTTTSSTASSESSSSSGTISSLPLKYRQRHASSSSSRTPASEIISGTAVRLWLLLLRGDAHHVYEHDVMLQQEEQLLEGERTQKQKQNRPLTLDVYLDDYMKDTPALACEPRLYSLTTALYSECAILNKPERSLLQRYVPAIVRLIATQYKTLHKAVEETIALQADRGSSMRVRYCVMHDEVLSLALQELRHARVDLESEQERLRGPVELANRADGAQKTTLAALEQTIGTLIMRRAVLRADMQREIEAAGAPAIVPSKFQNVALTSPRLQRRRAFSMLRHEAAEQKGVSGGGSTRSSRGRNNAIGGRQRSRSSSNNRNIPRAASDSQLPIVPNPHHLMTETTNRNDHEDERNHEQKEEEEAAWSQRQMAREFDRVMATEDPVYQAALHATRSISESAIEVSRNNSSTRGIRLGLAIMSDVNDDTKKKKNKKKKDTPRERKISKTRHSRQDGHTRKHSLLSWRPRARSSHTPTNNNHD